MTGKLQDKDMDQLQQWIGTGPKTFTLLYTITRDGCNATTFHQKCDGQGATVTMLYNQQGSVYGGYASQSWSSSGTWIKDANAFLYQLQYSGTSTVRKFACKDATYSYHCGGSYGPLFGSGHDLNTFNGTINNSGGYFTLNGNMNSFGQTYDAQGIQAHQINNGSLNVTELEVYKVADGLRTPKVLATWRKTPIWNEKFLDSLKENLVSFKPLADLKIPQARVLMIGPVGAGKSSFYNTINSIFKERIASRACSGNAEQSLTTAYTQYKVRSRSGASLDFRLCDTRGLEESQGLDVLECNHLLDGNVPDYYEFNPTSPINPSTHGFVSKPTPGDKIHCVAFIVDASTLDVLSTKIVEKMKSFQKLTIQKGIPLAIVLTKVDKICKEVKSNVSEAFRSETVMKHVDKASQIFGIPSGQVLPVKNYDTEIELDDNTSILALLALRQILNLAEDYMENLLDKMDVDRNAFQKMNIKD